MLKARHTNTNTNTNTIFLSYCLLVSAVLATSLAAIQGDGNKDFYIVFLRDEPVDADSTIRSHVNVLSTLKGSDFDAEESLVYSYTKIFNAFAAKLREDEAEELSGMEGVISVFKNRYHKLHTTKSWDFIGLPLAAKRNLKLESDIIVGVLDTGITPESESFGDKGFGPPPAKWKGSCAKSANFSGCNKKLIGAEYFRLDSEDPFPTDVLSPLDSDGHGTHTASTVAGNLVLNASLFGIANGTSRGGVPSARVAAYKVCWGYGCPDMDLLAGFEAAIHDGVDVISISIGGPSSGYAADSISVGSFHAMKKGIITVASAGNNGPSLGLVLNHAPWLFTVAASGIDRQFRSDVVLGNGKNVSGIGVNTYDPEQKSYPLASGSSVAKGSDVSGASWCYQESLDPRKVKGKILLCKEGGGSVESTVKAFGGIGTIVEDDFYLDNAQIFLGSATKVNTSQGDILRKYLNSTRSPSGVIYKSHEVKIPAPFVASFSSRGPSSGSNNLLKPDIAAPGVDILASFTPLKTLTGMSGDTRHSKFTLMSGTSMACPHVSGIAAYVKSFHPDWSPAMIRSAIMTTATPMSSKVDADAEFAYGAGQVNPSRAVNPGLVYDLDEMSYIQFLCHEGFSGPSLAPLIGTKSTNCSTLVPGVGRDALNYPTMQLTLKRKTKPTTTVFRRRVTNVGPSPCIYNVTVRAPEGVEIAVTPTSLSFSKPLQKRSFKVVVKARPMSEGHFVSGSIAWKSPRYIVRSPIVVYSPSS